MNSTVTTTTSSDEERSRAVKRAVLFTLLGIAAFIAACTGGNFLLVYLTTADFADRDADAERDLAAWTAGGQLVVVEDVIEGLENAPRGLIGLLAGENRGKRIIRVGPDPA